MAAVLLELVSAPPLEMPVPFKVKALVLVIVVPFKSNTAPLVTETAPVEAPSAAVLSIFTVPAAIVVPPL